MKKLLTALLVSVLLLCNLNIGVFAYEEEYEYYPVYTGSSYSISDILNQYYKVDGSYSYRKELAALNNISGYQGSSSQNLYMVELAKQGLLKKSVKVKSVQK